MSHPDAGAGFYEWFQRRHKTARRTSDDDVSSRVPFVCERFAIGQYDYRLTVE
jgi:hypothetical protein